MWEISLVINRILNSRRRNLDLDISETDLQNLHLNLILANGSNKFILNSRSLNLKH